MHLEIGNDSCQFYFFSPFPSGVKSWEQFFPFTKRPYFWKDYVIVESKQGATKVVIRCENGGENRGVPIYLNKMTITEHNS